MATNWDEPGKEYPSREDVQKIEREQRRRDREWNRKTARIDEYLRNHPSASWAEAEYKTNQGE